MAEWSKAPSLTACCLSPLPRLESRPGHVRKLPVTWCWAVVFTGYSGFLHYLQLASQELVTIWHKCDDEVIFEHFYSVK